MVFVDVWHCGPVGDSLIDGVERLVLSHVLVHLLAAPRRIVCNDCPIVVVLSGSADIHHEVDGTATAEKLATWYMVSPSISLRDGLEVPVVFILA
jgi:hypothetical protein